MTDQQEIEHFDKLADQWWNPKGDFRTLHHINPLRLAFITEYVELDQQNILDIGCGGGILSEGLAKHGAHVTAIDGSGAAIKVAKQHALEQGLSIHYEQADSHQWVPRYPALYHGVTCLELLEHVSDPQAIIQDCADLLIPGGHLFLSTINRSLKAYLGAIIGAEYLLKLIPRGTHHYEKFIRPSELSTCLRQAGLQLQTLQGYGYQPWSHKAYLSKDISINYFAYAIKAS